MKRWAINMIIAVMTTALIGIIAIQGYWLNFSIQLNEKKFDQNVAEALYAVKNHIEATLTEGDSGRNNFGITNRSSGFLRMDYFFSQTPYDTSYHLGNFLERQRKKDMAEVLSLLQGIPIEDLIDPVNLKESLRSELDQRGINARFVEGVFSLRKGKTVIYDGHFVSFSDSDARFSDPGVELPDRFQLSDAQYKIDLFATSLGALGQLRLYFPSRTQALWKDSWLILLGSLFFTALILFAFSYTLYIIFRQKKVSEMKNDFINNMTHEFKTPIATISLATDSLTSDKIIREPQKVRRFAKVITQENRRMLNQVEKVLQMALIDSRDFKLQIEEIHIHDILRDASDYIRLQLEKRGGEIELDLRAEDDLIKGDPTHIGNIIHNLLDNANKYSPEAPRIIVSTDQRSEGIEIRVRDHGFGMSNEDKKQIFDKFFRVHTGNLHDTKGFGLGLSYVKAIVTAHNGSIDVESELGKGSTFIVFLPYTP